MAEKKNETKHPKDYFKSERLRAREERFLAQCYLLSNMEEFIVPNKTRATTNIIPVIGDPAVFLGKLMTRSRMEKLLERITPAQLSALVPKVRLFKVYKNEYLNAPMEIELHFDDYLSNQDLVNITKSRFGRGSGVGLESCSWSFIGQNPAEASRMIKVIMVVFFAKLEDLMRGQAGEITFLDLIKPRRKKGEEITDLKPSEHQVRMEVGWAAPPAGHKLFEGDSELVEAIHNSSTSLYLSLKQHNLSFRQDGTLQMQIEYIGRIESDAGIGRFNIFPDSSCGDVTTPKTAKVKAAEQKKAAAKKTNEYHQCVFARTTGTSNAAKTRRLLATKKIKSSRKILKDALIELAAAKLDDKITKYESIIRELYNMQKVYSTAAPKNLLGIEQNITKRRKYKVSGKLYYKALNKAVCKLPTKIASPSNFAKTRVGRKKNQYKSSKYLKNVAKQFRLLSTTPKKSNCVIIHYFFLGDLLDVVINKFYDSSRKECFKADNAYVKFLIGSIVRRDDPSRPLLNMVDIPISLDLFTNWFATAVISRGKTKLDLHAFMSQIISGLISPMMNMKCLRDIKQTKRPISPRFISFYLPAEGDKKNHKDPLIKMTNAEFLSIAGKFKPTPSKIGTNKKENEKRKPIRNPQRGVIHRPGSLPEIDASGLEPIKTGARKRSKAGSLYSYMFLSAGEEIKFYRNVNYLRDIHDGIYHFNLATDAGLIKEINFNQVSLPGFAESIAEGTDLVWIKRIYHAEVTMFGNAVFIPGMKVYINPMTVGLGRADKGESVASKLGLGGYYTIIKVENHIESGKFETKLTCKYESKGNGFGYKTDVQNTKPLTLEDCKKIMPPKKGK